MKKLLIIAAATIMTIGCAVTDDNGQSDGSLVSVNLSEQEIEAYGGAVLDYSDVEIKYPGAESAEEPAMARLAAEAVTAPPPPPNMVGEPSILFGIGRDMVGRINGHIHHVMRHVNFIKSHPPTSKEGETLIWGPRTPDGEPYGVKLEVEREDNGSYQWQLLAVDEANEIEATLAEGTWTGAATDTIGKGSGTIDLYFDPELEVRPTEARSGSIHVDFDNSSDPVTVDVELVAFKDRPDMPEINRVTHHSRYADGSGTLISADERDIPRMHLPGSLPTDETELAELAGIWNADGEARAVLRTSGGDLGDNFGDLQQCADIEHLTVWEMLVINGDTAVFENGDEADCAFGAEDVPAFIE